MADIGEPLRRIKVIPTRHPVRGPEPALPAPQRREEAPTAPTRVPEREPA